MVATNSQCELWQGTLSTGGYGRDGVHSAHRARWEREHGPIPAGHHVHHVCGNPSCVNLDHLECLPAEAHRLVHKFDRMKGPVVTLRDVRQGRGLSLRKLEERACIPRATLSRIERGYQAATWEEIAQLERALELAPESLRLGIVLILDEVHP